MKKTSYFESNPKFADEIIGVIKNRGVTGAKTSASGSLMKVDINPSPEKFLDWDKPLSEQGKPVLDSLRKAGLIDQDGYVGTLSGAKHIDDISGDDFHAIIKDQYANNYGEKKLLSTKAKNADEAVSKYLNDLGIPGIRYLDQGSRGGKSFSEFVKNPPFKIKESTKGTYYQGGTIHLEKSNTPSLLYGSESGALEHEIGHAYAEMGGGNYSALKEIKPSAHIQILGKRYPDPLPLGSERHDVVQRAADTMAAYRQNPQLLTKQERQWAEDTLRKAYQSFEGKQTYNYVVFNDKDVSILEKGMERK